MDIYYPKTDRIIYNPSLRRVPPTRNPPKSGILNKLDYLQNKYPILATFITIIVFIIVIVIIFTIIYTINKKN
jgi:hypothetical protein